MNMSRTVRNLWRLQASTKSLAWRVQQRAAATLVEYAFIITIVSIAAIVALAGIGKRAHDLLEMTNSNMLK
jgi:Flp pilus assembly pilin Flp